MSTAFSVLELAKEGDLNAIATLIKQKLESKGIRVKLQCDQGNINLFLESSNLGGKTVGQAVYKYVETSKFNLKFINYIRIYKPKENKWKLVYRVEVNQKQNEKVIALEVNSPRTTTLLETNDNSSDLLPLKQDLKNLYQSVQTEINRLSQISCQLERVLQTLEPNTPLSPPTATNNLTCDQPIPPPTQLINWLQQLNINITSSHQPSDQDEVINKLANIIGNNYQYLSRLHQAIVKSIGDKSNFHLNLYNSTQLEISNATQLCNQLQSRSFLSSYHYNKNNKQISGKVDQKGDIINFFNGIWFERFIYTKITDLFNQYHLTYQCLINPKLEFTNGDKFELDFLFWVKDQVLWLECKSGKNYNQNIITYENHKNSLELSKESSLMILLQANEQQTVELTQLRDLTVVNPDNCTETIKQALNLDN